jgi:hypothetical protein
VPDAYQRGTEMTNATPSARTGKQDDDDTIEPVDVLRVRRLEVVDDTGVIRISTQVFAGGYAGIHVHHPTLIETGDPRALATLEAGRDVEDDKAPPAAVVIDDGTRVVVIDRDGCGRRLDVLERQAGDVRALLTQCLALVAARKPRSLDEDLDAAIREGEIRAVNDRCASLERALGVVASALNIEARHVGQVRVDVVCPGCGAEFESDRIREHVSSGECAHWQATEAQRRELEAQIAALNGGQ